MPRLNHGQSVDLNELRSARETLVSRIEDIPLAFALAQPIDVKDFDFLFSDLQNDSANLLPVARATRDNLVALGQSMVDPVPGDSSPPGDSDIPAAYTYFGQFVDHDITLETEAGKVDVLLDPDLVPLTVDEIQAQIQNVRTATLDLDSVYGPPAPRDPANHSKMLIGSVSPLNRTEKPLLRPPGKDDHNDLPRQQRNPDPTLDRAALIGDPRNDENTIVAQMHVAFLRAHNKLIDDGKNFRQAQRTLRQHYQSIVVHDFLKRIADPQIVDGILANGNQVFDLSRREFFMPLEFSFAAYRFGHSMARAAYNFNLNFNFSREVGTAPATFDFLFSFTALMGNFQPNRDTNVPHNEQGTDRLPENWIIEWENLVDAGQKFDRARRIDTKIVEPLFHLRREDATELSGLAAHLAVRNLLRGYRLSLPTGQAVAQALNLQPLTPQEIQEAAASPDQSKVLQDAGFLSRTPLWYYILAEASARAKGQHLGPVGSTIIAEVLIGLVRRSENSILRGKGWKPSLPSAQKDTFTLPDLLRFAEVL